MRNVDRIIRDLADGVDELDARFSLLRSIDREIAGNTKSLPIVIEDVCLRLKALLHAERVGVFLVADELRPFDIGRDQPGEVVFVPKNAHPKLPDDVVFVDAWPAGEPRSTLLVPIWWRKKHFALLVLQDNRPARISRLADHEVIEYCRGVADQLSVLAQNRIDGHVQEIRQRLILEFFEHQLRPTACWAAIAGMVSKFLPPWAPAALERAPRVQLLTYRPGDRYLVLSADDQTADSSSFQALPLRVDQTVTGLLIELNDSKEEDILLVDPNDHRDRYQSYLFDSAIPHSELVLTIRHGGEIIGLLNLEHPQSKVFLPLHIDILADVARFLGPFVDALVAREDRQRAKEISMLYVQSKLLARMASTFRHKVGQSLMQSRFALENLEQVTSAESAPVIGHLRDAINQFNERSVTFLADLPKFIFYSEIDVAAAMREAIAEFDLEEKTEDIQVDLHDHCGDPCLVWASRLLREHFYNLLKNSFDAVRVRIAKGRIRKGIITVTLAKETVTDLLERETSAPRVLVTIEDNGGGVAPTDVEKIREFGYSTKLDHGGSGFGLSAAIEYAQSVGGDLYYENKLDTGFAVKMILQEYTPSYHEAMRKRMLVSNVRIGELV